jgi:hypothetical protein
MALVVKDRVKEVTTTTGTADLTLGGAVYGFQSFAIIGNGNTTYYGIYDSNTGDWEVGIGTYTTAGPTLTRTTVFESSNSGSKVVFGAGTKDVFVTYPAERAVYLDAAGSAVTLLDVGTLGVGTANITTANITAGTISTTPTNNTDIVNKQYADAIASGIHFHEAVGYATTAALPAVTYNNGTGGVGATLTANANGALTVDGYTFVSPADNGTRILIKNQADGAQNGVYTLTQAGNSSPGAPFILTRATDFDSVGTGVDQIDEGDFFLVTGGTANVNTAWVQQTPPPITIGTTAIVFQQFSAPITYTAGTGLSESPSYTFNIANIGTAGTYGTASQVPVFVTNAQGQVTSVTNTGIAISAGAVSGLAASATTDTTNASNITSGTLPVARLSGSYTGITGVGTLAAGTWNASTIGATFGGTGLTTYAQGDLLYATSSTTLGRLADVVTGNALISGGVGGDPAWGKIGLQTHVDGTLQVVNGGTGATTLTGYVYGNGTGAFTASTSIPNSATTATSANTASAIVARDASGNFSAGTITASLSGNASTATSATSATTATNLAGGVAGAIPYQSAGGTTLFSAAGTSGQYLQSNGTSAPSWSTLPTIGNGTLTMAVSGTGLSGSATFTANQSGNSTFTVTSNATNANTASTIVARDASGNFSAGTITATLSGSATQVSNSLTLATSGTGLSGSATFNGASAQTFTVTSNATSANTASTIVARDASGNFSAGTITATLSGTATTGTNWGSYGAVPAAGTSFGNANTIGRSDANGYTYFFYINSNTNNNENPSVSQVIVTNGGDNFYRKASIAHLTSSLSGTAPINISGNAATATTADQIDSWPFRNTGSNAGVNADTLDSNGITYYTAGVPNFTGNATDGALYSQAYSSSWQHQIAADYRSGQIALRGKNSGTWQSWRTVLDSGNYTSYAPSLTGSGASGTWGISITGNAGNTSSISNAVGGSYTWTATQYFTGNGNTASASNIGAQAYSTGGNGAIMAFHRGGQYAVNMGLDSDNILRIGGWSAPANLFQMNMSGNLTMAGNVTAHSDERLKKDWAPVKEGFVEQLASIKSGTYTRIDSEERQAGCSAQDWQNLLPEVVTADNQGTLSLAYGNAALVACVELAKEVAALRAELRALKASKE